MDGQKLRCAVVGETSKSRTKELDFHLLIKNNKNPTFIEKPSWSSFLPFPKRYFVILLILLSLLFNAHLITNTNIVVVEISTPKTIAQENGSTIVKALYNWTSAEAGFILSISHLGEFFAGFAGVLISKIGGGTFLGMSQLALAIITFSAPLSINTHPSLFIINRFVMGVLLGISSLSYTDVFIHWVPPTERVRLIACASLGIAIGFASSNPISGFIIYHFGWQTLFYVCGTVLLIWSCTWIAFVKNDPSTDKFMSEEEKTYLSIKMNFVTEEKVKIPYKNILKSVPVYALLNESFVSAFTTSFITLIPRYVKDVNHVDIQTVGFISGIPEFSALIARPLFACLADYLRSKPDGLGIGKVHKLFLFCGQSLMVVFFFIAAMVNNLVGCIICLTFVKFFFTMSNVSFGVITMDVAGQYATFLQSMILFVVNIASFINPLIIGFLVPSRSQSEWNTYFLLISFLTTYGVVIFLIFGSGDLQPWAKTATKNRANRDDKSLIE